MREHHRIKLAKRHVKECKAHLRACNLDHRDGTQVFINLQAQHGCDQR